MISMSVIRFASTPMEVIAVPASKGTDFKEYMIVQVNKLDYMESPLLFHTKPKSYRLSFLTD